MLQVGAIGPQSMPAVLNSIHECLDSNDWVTRKAAADALSALASDSSQLVADGSASTIAALEACRFDKVILLILSFKSKQVNTPSNGAIEHTSHVLF